MTPANYLAALNSLLATGRAREHAYRGDLQQLLQYILPDTHTVINEPSQVRGVGNPDFLIRNDNEVAVGYIEAKDIGKDLDDKSYKEQFDRYRGGLDNLIITDYLRFDFYQSGTLVHTVTIGTLSGDIIVAKGSEYDRFTNLIRDFGAYQGEPIRSPKRLAELMAGKARLLQDILRRAVEADIEVGNDSELRGQYRTFKDVLLHDLEPRQFSDLYAQTLAYGLFAARLHDETLDNFSRQEAGELIPKSNPFLKQLFGYVAGYNIDSRIRTVVDNLADIFLLADVRTLMTDYGKKTAQNDAVVHFYETFLAEYDPKLRKQRGVWYTPQPVVDFIVRAVDDLLKSEFGLKDGLADNSKIKVRVKNTEKGARGAANSRAQTLEREVHRVQVLDPATGTGTFLATTIKYIFERNFKMMPGAWPDYVEQHLIPRLNGFELLMASYAMAHLKLDLTLRETGYTRELGERFRVYLTNALEADHPDTGTLFAGFLSKEANEANAIKRDTPVMVVMGNPPYAVSSANKGEYIQELLEEYKKDLNERKINLDDDYIKFIRLGQEMIRRNGEGILAYISNNSFLDGITHRSMRNSLLNEFDKIYIVDLHGSSMKKEVAIDGSKDENVFDIRSGVSLFLALKRAPQTTKIKQSIYKANLLGKRKYKYKFLNNNSLASIKWRILKPQEPFCFFREFDYDAHRTYGNFMPVSELMTHCNSGLQSKRDGLSINFDESRLLTILREFDSLDISSIRRKYELPKDNRDWSIEQAQKDLRENNPVVRPILYRPFDIRKTLYTGVSKGFHGYPRLKTFQHLIDKENISLITCRQQSTFEFQHLFVSTEVSDLNSISIQTKEQSYVLPLYRYPQDPTPQTTPAPSQLTLAPAAAPKETPSRVPNLDKKLLAKIATGLGLRFTPEKEDDPATFAPIDLLDYIYAVLHDPAYRETYAEFLKIDFPRVPFPEDLERFRKLVRLGGELRRVHLLEHPLVDEPLASYRGTGGDNLVSRRLTKNSPGWVADEADPALGKVWINDQQYFADVPLAAWEFYIGGYQPAQKWLKDRRDRNLSYDDIRHYLRIVRALTETGRLMEELRGLAGAGEKV